MKNEPTNILQYADDTVFVGEATWDNDTIGKRFKFREILNDCSPLCELE